MKRVASLLLILALLTAAFPASADPFDPHKALAYMDVRFECGCNIYGIGAMIGRRGLITCGHNLFCSKHGKRLKSINFLFGAKSAASGTKKYTGKFTFWSYDTFSGGYDSTNDIGYVVFNSPIGDSTGWFGYSTASDSRLKDQYANVYYYTNHAKYKTLFTKMYVLNSKQIYMEPYDPISGGGAPVTFDDEKVVAVHTSHSTSSGREYARRLTDDVIRDMKRDGAFD